MSRTLAAAVGAALLPATCVVAVPAPALAGDEYPSRVVLRDGPGDVWMQSNSDDPVRTNRPTVDITRAVARHGRRAVTARMRFVNLRRVDGIHLFFTEITTPAGAFSAGVEASPRNWRGSSVLFDETGNNAGCRGITHRIDYAEDRVTIRVPRHCLRRPAWVRLSMLNGFQKWSDDETEVWFFDNAHNHRATAGRTRRLSPA